MNEIWTRPFHSQDLPHIKEIDCRLFPNVPHFNVSASRDWLWVVGKGAARWGYTAVTPIPGIDDIFELHGGILPEKRRRGAGSRLLQHTLDDLSGSEVRQLSYGVADLNEPAAHFLRARQFYIEHEEYLYELPFSDGAAPVDHSISSIINNIHLTIKSYRRPFAIRHFRVLYYQTFSPYPWYQPFSKKEIEETLESPSDILFLTRGKKPFGFVWTRKDGSIEPIGVIKEEQGKGYGRYLLFAALDHLQQQGAARAQIGVWKRNETAVRLYESVGFRKTQTLTYLACDLR